MALPLVVFVIAMLPLFVLLLMVIDDDDEYERVVVGLRAAGDELGLDPGSIHQRHKTGSADIFSILELGLISQDPFQLLLEKNSFCPISFPRYFSCQGKREAHLSHPAHLHAAILYVLNCFPVLRKHYLVQLLIYILPVFHVPRHQHIAAVRDHNLHTVL